MKDFVFSGKNIFCRSISENQNSCNHSTVSSQSFRYKSFLGLISAWEFFFIELNVFVDFYLLYSIEKTL